MASGKKMFFSIFIITSALSIAAYVFFVLGKEDREWKKTSEKNTLAAYELYIEAYPEGKYANEAQAILDSIKGHFTDSRDTRTYKTVKIGNQEWMAENLAYLPKVCPENMHCGYWVYGVKDTNRIDAINTENFRKYGVLYDFETAQNVCPEGWHLPSDKEWGTLMKNIDSIISPERSHQKGTILKSYHGWASHLSDFGNGTDDFGFDARPAGERDCELGRYSMLENPKFRSVLHSTSWWSSTAKNSQSAICFSVSDGDYSLRQNNRLKNIGYSIRCIKD